MPQPRMIPFESLTSEEIARQEREIQRACQIISCEPDRRATVVIKWTVERNDRTGNIEQRCSITSHYGDRESRCVAWLRDGQLVIPGTEILADLEPEPSA